MSDAAPSPTSPAPWRRLGLERGAPADLLRRGAELLDTMTPEAEPILRWYVATAPALVLGRGQRAEEVHTALDVVRRHSGGGAVLMDAHLLSLDVIAPAGHPLVAGDVTQVFLRVGHAWAAALGDLGVEDLDVHTGASAARRLGTPRQRLLAAVCFAQPGRGEVLHQGRKLVGLSQRRRRHGALVQCGLLRAWRPQPLLDALGADPSDAEVLGAAVGLEALVHPAPDDDTVMAAVERRMVQGEGW